MATTLYISIRRLSRFATMPPLTGLGRMPGANRNDLMLARWIAVAPTVTIFLTTLSIGIVGDWLRDKLDPTLRGR